MTIDEAIKHAKKVAEVQEEAAKEWHENQVRKCELIPFAEMDYTHENNCKKCAEEHRQLAEWLKELKQLREQTRWISVSERLPEFGQDVLLSLRSLDIKTGFRAETEPYFYCHGVDGCYIEPQNVLAWMPLPEPYKAESEGKE